VLRGTLTQARPKWLVRQRLINCDDCQSAASRGGFIRAVDALGSDEAKAVVAKMRDVPIHDFFADYGHLRADGRMVHDMYLVEVKKPEESHYPWDYYKILKIIPGEEAFRPMSEGGCPLLAKP
jgi:branched-chain amino acid transport system substrate-binding protein